MTSRPPVSFRPSESIARLIVVGIAILMAVVRIPMLSVMHRPGVFWDEITYLNFARYFSGAGAPLDFSVDPSVEHAGYGLVIAPAFATQAPFEVAYHLALDINLVLGVCLTLLAYRIARRIACASRLIAVLCAVAITAYPAFFVLPLFIFSENVVFPLVLLCVLSFYEIAENPKSVGWHLAYVVSMVGMWFAHAPSIVIIVVAFAGLVCLTILRRLAFVYASADVAVVIVGMILIEDLHRHLWRLSWGTRSDSTLVPQILGGITPNWLSDSFHALSYQQVGIVLPTLGVYVLAVGMLVREVNAARQSSWTSRALACAFALAATVGTALMSATFLAAFPGLLLQLDALFTTRYAEMGVLPTLVIGMPLFFTIRVRLRPYAYAAIGAIVLTAILTFPDYVGTLYLAGGESISELAWSGFARLLHGAPMYALAAFSLAGLALVLWSQRTRPVVGLAALTVVGLAASFAEIKGQIGPAQSNYDTLIGAYTSRLAPYIRVMPQYTDIALAQAGLNIATFNLIALDVPSHRFSVVNWTPGADPGRDVAIAGKAYAPPGFTEIACEEFAPISCLYVRDKATATYLLSLEQVDAFGAHPILTLGDGLEIGVDDSVAVPWQGVYGIEKTPDMTAFRWTNGDARVILPFLTEPAAYAQILLVAPNRGHVTIDVQRPGKSAVRVVDAPDLPNGNGFLIPLRPYVPGTTISIRTTNVHPASTPTARLSVEIRTFRLLPPATAARKPS